MRKRKIGIVVLGIFAAVNCSAAKQKPTSAKHDGLAEYLQRISAKAPEIAPTSLGSLWNDRGGATWSPTTRRPALETW